MNEDLILEQGIETHDKLDEIVTSSEHNIQATSDIVEELKDLNKTNENILVQNEDKFTELTNEIKQVTEAIKAIPESEPHPETVVISNLPEVQKVEITNLPKEKDDKQELEMLGKINDELIKIGEKEIDLTQLKDLLSTLIEKTDNLDKPETPEIDVRPELKDIQTILNLLNENVVAIEIPEFDYKQLAKILKENISFNGGGGYETVANASGVRINPATAERQDTGNGHLSKLVGLEIPAHDYISLSYTGSNLTGVVYKTGGSGGTTVATLTLAYTGSVLDSITKT